MKQRPTTTNSFRYDLGDDEIEVADILLQLPTLFAQSNSPIRVSLLSWGSKGKRTRSTNETMTALSKRLCLPSESVLPTFNGCGGGGLAIRSFKTEKPVVKGKASSPATPLSFSSSESDEKPKRLKTKTSYKKKKEELLSMIDEHTKMKESLTKELAEYKSMCEKLKQYNLKLRAMEQELKISGLQDTVFGSNEDQHHRGRVELMVGQRPLIKDKASYNPNPYPYDNGQTLSSFSAAKSVSHSDGGLGNMIVVMKNNVGTSSDRGGIFYLPDLNLSLEPVAEGGESFCLDFGEAGVDVRDRAMSAQARQRRIKICREKKSKSAANKLYILSPR